MRCNKCDKVLGFEKIITPDGNAYHVKCWNRGLDRRRSKWRGIIKSPAERI